MIHKVENISPPDSIAPFLPPSLHRPIVVAISKDRFQLNSHWRTARKLPTLQRMDG